MLTKRKLHGHSEPTRKHPVPAAEEKNTEEMFESDIDDGLSVIYGDERDDLKVVTRGGSRVTRFLLRSIIFLIVAFILTIVGYFGYQRFFASNHEGKPLIMEFVALDELQSGMPTAIELDYRNQTSYPLTGVEIDINLPSGFVMRAATPTATVSADLIFDLGTVPGGSDGKIIIDGVWNVDVPSTTGIQALAAYKPANFNAQFHDIATKTIATNTSATIVVIDAPETANVGETITYTVHVQNSGTETLAVPQVALVLPAGFFVQSSAPPLVSGGGSTYTLADILPAAESTIVITGAFASDVLGTQTLTATAGIAGARFSAQAMASAITDVKGSALALTMVGNGTQGTVIADPGSLLHIALRLENTSDAPVSDASALLDFTAEDNLPIDWKTAILASGKATAQGIVYDAKTLGTIAPGEHKTLDLSIPLKTDLSAVSSTFTVLFSGTHGVITVQAAPLIVTLNSDASLLSTLRYYDDDGSPLGSGPLPPTVGNRTHYRAVWTIASGLHGLNDVTVSAVLPDGIVWDDFSTTTSGLISYDLSTRTVRWSLSSVPAESAAVLARFSVSLSPVAADVGLTKTVIGKAVLNAKDDVTSAVIERSADAVSTECAGDTFASGKGMVKG